MSQDKLIDLQHTIAEMLAMIHSFQENHDGINYCTKCSSYAGTVCSEILIHNIGKLCEREIYDN